MGEESVMDVLYVTLITMAIFVFWGSLFGGISGLFTRDWQVGWDNFRGFAGLAVAVPIFALVGWIFSLAR